MTYMKTNEIFGIIVLGYVGYKAYRVVKAVGAVAKEAIKTKKAEKKAQEYKIKFDSIKNQKGLIYTEFVD